MGLAMSGHIGINRTSDRFRSTSTSLVIAACATSDCIASSDIGVWPAIKIASHRIASAQNRQTSPDIATSHRIPSQDVPGLLYCHTHASLSAPYPLPAHPCQPPDFASTSHRIALVACGRSIGDVSHRQGIAFGCVMPMASAEVTSHRIAGAWAALSHRISLPAHCHHVESHCIHRSKPM